MLDNIHIRSEQKVNLTFAAQPALSTTTTSPDPTKIYVADFTLQELQINAHGFQTNM